MIQSWFDRVAGWQLYLMVTSFYLGLVFFSQQFLFTDELVRNQLSEIYPAYMIQDVLELRSRFWWVGYVLEPIILFLKLLLFFLPVSVLALLSDLNYSPRDIFKAALFAEFAFFIQRFWYTALSSKHTDKLFDSTIIDLYPLSLIGILGSRNVVHWLVYPLQTINIFEMIFIVITSWFLSRCWSMGFATTLNLVLPAYLIGLVLWMGFVVFVTIQLI